MTDPLADTLRTLWLTDRPYFGDTGGNPVGWEKMARTLRALGWVNPYEQLADKLRDAGLECAPGDLVAVAESFAVGTEPHCPACNDTGVRQ